MRHIAQMLLGAGVVLAVLKVPVMATGLIFAALVAALLAFKAER